MKQQDKAIAGISLVAACAAIGIGAAVSSSAMATSDGPGTATVTVVSGTVDGSEIFSCTFQDVAMSDSDPSGAAPQLPPPDAEAAIAGSETGHGDTIEAPHGERAATSGDDGDFVTVNGDSLAEDETHDPANAIDFTMEDARPGTDDECAALRTQFEIG